ncbi:MAG: hypothetical protein HY979_00660 [Candidatus Magasanikbacteria bacterium]|nr:hypothetical protein [Candidatus Magasanikbacteria bacterium]
MLQVKAAILAGGPGSRLRSLTRHRPKPKVPFEKRCLIDFPISNCLHSSRVGIIEVFIQAHANKILRYVEDTYLAYVAGKPLRCQVTGDEKFEGSADVFRHCPFVFDEGDEHLLVLCADQVYLMDYDSVIEYHLAQKAAVTIITQQVPKAIASALGIAQIGADGNVNGFLEKPAEPPTIPGTDQCLASLGMYVFDAQALQEMIREISGNDIGGDLIPHAFATGRKVAVYEFPHYWRDVGTVHNLWLANMDLVGPCPQINLYDPHWPIYHRPGHLPSPKMVNGCQCTDAIISDGSIVAGTIVNSVLSTRVQVGHDSLIKSSVVFDQVTIGNNVVLDRVLVDKHAVIGDGVVLGVNPEVEVSHYPEL